MEIASNKTKSMMIAKYKLEVEGKENDQFMKLNYLEVDISSNKHLKKGKKRKAVKVAQIAEVLRNDLDQQLYEYGE